MRRKMVSSNGTACVPIVYTTKAHGPQWIVGSERELRGVIGLIAVRGGTIGGQCPKCGAPHYGTRDQKCDHL